MKQMIKKTVSLVLTLALVLSVCSAVTVTGQAAGVMRKVYEPATGLVGAPTVIQTVDTQAKLSALATSATPPQVAWFVVENGKELMVKLNDKSVALSDVLGFCKGKVIPLLEVADAETAELLAIELIVSDEGDAIIASTDKDALLAAHDVGAPNVTIAYIVAGKANKTLTTHIAHAAGAHMVVLSDGDRETVEYMQQRFLAVTLRRVDGSADRDCVGAAVDCGANGVVVNDPAVAYDLYEGVTKETYVRRAFIVGHRAYPTVAPENTVEGLRAAFAAGADAVECDVYLTKDNQVVINHNGNIMGYTTDDSAKGNIESFTREELKKYTLKAVGSNNKCKFAFLDEFYEVLKTKPDKMLVVEIKTGNNKVMDYVKSLAEEYGVMNQIVIISFATGHLQYARNLMPSVGLSRLHNGASEEEMLNLLDDLGASNSPNYSVSKQHVYALQHRGITSNLWTVDGEENLKTQAAKGAQFLTTDNPNFSEAMEDFFGDMSCQNIFGFKPAAATAVLTTTKKTTTTTASTTASTVKSTAASTTDKPIASSTTLASGTTTSTSVVSEPSTGDSSTAAIGTELTTTDTTASVTDAGNITTTTAAGSNPQSEGFDMWWIIPVGIVILAGVVIAIVLVTKKKK